MCRRTSIYLAAALGLLLVVCEVYWRSRAESKREERETFTVQVDGEPVARNDPSRFDLNILAGGSNLHARSHHLPLLALEKQWTFESKGKPMDQRSIDVLYRSSNCTGRREEMAASLRKKVEANGFKFVSTGKCSAGATRDESSVAQSATTNWGECPECDDAKMIVAFENYANGGDYLSEKAYLPAQHGAIPLYEGNGLHLYRRSGMNAARMIVHSGDTAVFEDDVIGTLQSKEKLNKLYELDVGTPSLLPDLNRIRQQTCTDPKLNKLRSRDTVRVYSETRIPDMENWLPVALCLEAKPFAFSDKKGDADVHVSGCCW